MASYKLFLFGSGQGLYVSYWIEVEEAGGGGTENNKQWNTKMAVIY